MFLFNRLTHWGGGKDGYKCTYVWDLHNINLSSKIGSVVQKERFFQDRSDYKRKWAGYLRRMAWDWSSAISGGYNDVVKCLAEKSIHLLA